MPTILPDSIGFHLIDALDTDGGWLTTSVLVRAVSRRLPGTKAGSVHRNLYRLRRGGIVEGTRRSATNEAKWRYVKQESDGDAL
jgi:Fe2+ or Zn2+ uptake regulation protein